MLNEGYKIVHSRKTSSLLEQRNPKYKHKYTWAKWVCTSEHEQSCNRSEWRGMHAYAT